jgi:hypothetical protein
MQCITGHLSVPVVETVEFYDPRVPPTPSLRYRYRQDSAAVSVAGDLFTGNRYSCLGYAQHHKAAVWECSLLRTRLWNTQR